MNDSDARAASAAAFFVLAVLAVVSIVPFVIGSLAAESDEQQKAIQAKVGRWVLDGETGRKAFVYGCEHVAKGRESEDKR